MSVTEYPVEPDPKLWEMYLMECRIDKTRPTISDYYVYLSDLDLEENLDEPN